MLAIAYVSTAAHPPSQFELEYLLVDARTFNARVDVTGALLLHEVTFFQYFEGPRDAAFEVYDRIRRAKLHRDIVELLCEEVPARQFAGWQMGFAEAPRGTLLELSQARWKTTADTVTNAAEHLDGVRLLIDFWHRSNRGAHAWSSVVATGLRG